MADSCNPIAIAPRPLIFSQHKIVLSWSPKSACSQALTWFLIQENLLATANARSRWPHYFRQRHYYNLLQYKLRFAAFAEARGRGYTLVRITRDPAKRLVSCFRHAVRFPAIDAIAIDELGCDVAAQGLSLAEFHRILKGKDLVSQNGFNAHVCVQEHPIWSEDFDRVITLNVDETDLFTSLSQIETALGLKKTSFESYPKFRYLANKHHARDVAYTGDVPIVEMRFERKDVRDFPKSALLGNPRMAGIVYDLHGRDLGKVSTCDTAGQLFLAADSVSVAIGAAHQEPPRC